MDQLETRIKERIREWNVMVESTRETPSSFLAFGSRGPLAVVLKVVRHPGDEWQSGQVLDAFAGRGMVRVYEHVDGAVLMERLSPATPLADLALSGRDDEATEILAQLMLRMPSLPEALDSCVTVETWGLGFERYLASGDARVPHSLVERGERVYVELCQSQRDVFLLHGDLQHYNVLYDADRAWTAIDPKGVVGELEYELGASLRNPGRPELFASPEAVRRRLGIYGATLKFDMHRALAWTFAQSVLSAIWSIEDGDDAGDGLSSLLLAHAVWPLVRSGA